MWKLHGSLKTVSSYSFVIKLKGLTFCSCIVPTVGKTRLQPLGLMRFVYVQGSWAVFGPACQGSLFWAPVCL